MKGFKLDSNGDVVISNLDKIPQEPLVFDGITTQNTTDKLIKGIYHTETQTGYGLILHGKNEKYKDTLTVDKKRHTATYVKTMNIATFDGTENWIKWSTNVYCNGKRQSGGSSVDRYSMCNSHWATTDVGWSNSEHNMVNVIDGLPKIGATTVDEWKAYLAEQAAAGTPFTVVYVLETPIITELEYVEPPVDCQIEMVEGNELLAQTVKTVLGTNKGEWALNTDEGITFANILGKHKNTDTKNTGNDALKKYYQDEIAGVQENNNENIDRLRQRLEGN